MFSTFCVRKLFDLQRHCLKYSAQEVIEEIAIEHSELSNSEIEPEGSMGAVLLNFQDFSDHCQLLFCRYEVPDDHPLLQGVCTLFKIQDIWLLPWHLLRHVSSWIQILSPHNLCIFTNSQMQKREPDDPSPYLLAIWTPGKWYIWAIWIVWMTLPQLHFQHKMKVFATSPEDIIFLWRHNWFGYQIC